MYIFDDKNIYMMVIEHRWEKGDTLEQSCSILLDLSWY